MKTKQNAIYLIDDNEHPYSGWEFDNRGQALSKRKPYAWYSFENISETYPTMLKRSFRPQNKGILTLESSFTIKDTDGFIYKITDKFGKCAFVLYTKAGNFYLRQSAGDVLAGKVNEHKSSIKIVLNLNEKTYLAYLNNIYCGAFSFADKVASLCQIHIGIDEKGTGSADIGGVKLYCDYIINERFLSPFAGTIPADWEFISDSQDNHAETVYSQNNTFSKEDTYYLKIRNHTGNSSLVKNFPLQQENTCFEIKFLIPEISDKDANIGFSLKRSDKLIFGIILKEDELFTSTEEKVDSYPINLWNTLRFELNTDKQTVLVRLNGKDKGVFSVPLILKEFDKLEISLNGKINISLDDILLFPISQEPSDYVPEPIPIESEGYHVGVHVCSLWRYGFWRGTNAAWDICTAFDELTPYMGYYDEGIPEVSDWETKWMCENGIDFQLQCWYGPEEINEPIKFAGFSHSLHDGYFNSKYKNYSKFAIMWENNFTSKITPEAFRKYLVPYFIEYYFKDPNYYKIDNCPVFSIYAFARLSSPAYFGSIDGLKTEMEYLKNEVKKAGFDDLILLFAGGSSTDPELAKNKEYVGADGTYSYNWGTSSHVADYQKSMISSVGDHLLRSTENLAHVPTVGVGFNSVARHDKRYPNISLDGYEEILRWTKDEFLASKKYFPDQESWKSKFLLLSCWNEYDEGHYINPSNLYGFGFLEKIKKVFCKESPNTNKKPTEHQKTRLEIMAPKGRATLRPTRNYVHPLPPKNANRVAIFSFSNKAQHTLWDITGTTKDGQFKNGKMSAVSTGIDPSITYNWELNYPTSEIDFIHIRLKSNPCANNKTVSLFAYFRTDESNNFSGNKSLSAQYDAGVSCDVYLDTRACSLWSGNLTGIRLDPMDQDGTFEFELIEFIKYDLNNKIYIDDKEIVLDFPIEIKKKEQTSIPFNPLTGIFNHLNFYYEWNRIKKSLFISADNIDFLFTIGSDKVFINEKQVDLPNTPYLFDGIPMLPLEFILSHCKGYTFSINSDDKIIVTTPIANTSLLS